jgi:hypothetical protein
MCTCPTGSPTGTNPWTQYICNFNEAGNYNNEHPFQKDFVSICNRSFVIPFPTPQPVCATCQDLKNCPAPTATATCVGTGASATWVVQGDTPISAITTVNCSTRIVGSLTGGSTDELRITYCGFLNVTGSISFSAPPRLEVSMLAKGGVAVPGAYIHIMTFGGGSPVFQEPFLLNVWSPSVDLSARAQSSAANTYINFFATSDQSPAPTNLPPPDNSPVLQTSPPTETVPPPTPGAGDTLINPDRTPPPGAPGFPASGPAAPGNNSAKKKGLPGWAIFLIVLACIIGVVLLIGIIILLISSSGKEERM